MIERKEKGLLSGDEVFMLVNLKDGIFFNHCRGSLCVLFRKRLLNVNEWGIRVNPSRE